MLYNSEWQFVNNVTKKLGDEMSKQIVLNSWLKWVILLSFIVVGCREDRPTPLATVAYPGPEPTQAILAYPIGESTTGQPNEEGIVPAGNGPTIPKPTLVVSWNEAALAAVRNGSPRPTVTARALFMVHQAMYDAWAMYDSVATPTLLSPSLRRPPAEQTEANKREAVSYAAYQMLTSLFPDYEASSGVFGRLMAMYSFAIVDEAAITTPAGIGLAAAQAVLEARANDGSNAANNFSDTTSEVFPELYRPVNSANPTERNSIGAPNFDLNHWAPLRVPTGLLENNLGQPVFSNSNPASYKDQSFLTPHWGAVRPFALTAGDQFRPTAPPQAGSAEPYTDGLGQTMTNDQAYHLQLSQVLSYSANLTDQQKVIAEYWADGPRSETPPGHWNALAHGLSYRDQHTLDEDVKLFFALNGALLDASIACWDAKRAYDYIRPVSAIRQLYWNETILAWGGPDQGPQEILGRFWQPYQDPTFVTPPFPEYTSGHSTFSAASAAILTLFTGSDRFYDGQTTLYYEDFNRDGLPDMLGQHIVIAGKNMFESSPTAPVVLQWPTFLDAANEAGLSRRYGGIHFQDADLRGREAGRQIGTQAFALAESYWNGQR